MPAASAGSPLEQALPEIGARGQLIDPSRQAQALLALSLDSYDALRQSYDRGSEPMRMRLILDGQVLVVLGQPQVEIIAHNVLRGAVQVRVLEGSLAGREGWVAPSHVVLPKGPRR